MEPSDFAWGALFLGLSIAGAVAMDSVDRAAAPAEVKAVAAPCKTMTASDIHALLAKEPVSAVAFDWILEQAGLIEAPTPPDGWEYKEKKGMFSLAKKK